MTAIRTTSAVTSQQTQLRQTAQGDVAPDFAPAQIEQFVVGQAVGRRTTPVKPLCETFFRE